MAKQPDLFIDPKVAEGIPTRRVRWKSAYRLVPSRYPPIDLFERIADPDDWQLLFELEFSYQSTPATTGWRNKPRSAVKKSYGTGRIRCDGTFHTRKYRSPIAIFGWFLRTLLRRKQV